MSVSVRESMVAGDAGAPLAVTLSSSDRARATPTMSPYRLQPGRRWPGWTRVWAEPAEAAPAVLAIADPSTLDGELLDPLAELVGWGYQAQWVVLDAAEVGACFSQPELFLLATPADRGNEGTAAAFGEHTALATLIPAAGWSKPEMGLFGAVPFVGSLPAAGALRGTVVHGLGEFGAAGLHQYLGALLDDDADRWVNRFGWTLGGRRRAREMLGRAVAAQSPTDLGSAILVAAQGGGPRPSEALLPRPTTEMAPRGTGRRRATLPEVVAALDQTPPPDVDEQLQQSLPGMGHTAAARPPTPTFQWGRFLPAIARHEYVAAAAAPAPLAAAETNPGPLEEAFMGWMLMGPGGGHCEHSGSADGPDLGPSPQLLLAVHVLSAIGRWRGTWM